MICIKSRTQLSWKRHFLCSLFSLLSAKQCSLLQGCTCMPSVVFNTTKNVFQRFIPLKVFSAYSCVSLMKLNCSKFSWLLYFKQFHSSVSTVKDPRSNVLLTTELLSLNVHTCHALKVPCVAISFCSSCELKHI